MFQKSSRNLFAIEILLYVVIVDVVVVPQPNSCGIQFFRTDKMNIEWRIYK